MGKLFYVMGKSSSGKDTIYEEVLSRKELGLKPFVMYTTRPIRAKETDGVQYHFVSEEQLHDMQKNGQVIELRAYDTSKCPLILKQIEDMLPLYGERFTCVFMRKMVAFYIRGLTGATALRRTLLSCPDTNELKKIVSSIEF